MAISSDISSFSPDDSPKLGRVCEITGAPFQPGDKVYSVLYEKDGQINRRDVCAAAWRTTPRPENTLAWWSTRVRADEGKDKKVKLAPNDALTALFVSLADKPGQEALRYTLALLLADALERGLHLLIERIAAHTVLCFVDEDWEVAIVMLHSRHIVKEPNAFDVA